jgi:hypothetical protein
MGISSGWRRSVRFIRISSEDEMIALYLHEELTGRFENKVSDILEQESIDRSIIYTPDLAVASENELRRHILGLYRGYGAVSDDGYLAGFPHDDVRWEWHAITPDELWNVRYVRIAYWLELSGGSLLYRSRLTAS